MEKAEEDLWIPKTSMGKLVKEGNVTDIDTLLQNGTRILEPEIVTRLVKNLEIELLAVGQSKGKFGGGKKSIWKQTQKKTKEGNKPKFGTLALIGNRNGYVGIGYGKSKETMPAREKAIRQATLNVIKVPRGCGSWACACNTEHSLPYKVTGKTGAVRITLVPAARGTGLKAEENVRKILAFAGITDAYATATKTQTKLNLLYATFSALQELSRFRS